MNTVSLAAQIRTAFGKNQVKQLKNSGLIPAIVYGNAAEPVAISVNPIDLQKLFSKSEFGKNTLISLELPDTKLTVIPHAFDRDVFTQQFTHADFKLVSDTVPVVIETPLVFKGIAPGTKMGGLLEKKVFKVKISCLPQDVPANIIVDISNMGIGASIFLKDLTPPNGVSYVTSGNTLIARISVPRGKTEEDASATPAKK